MELGIWERVFSISVVSQDQRMKRKRSAAATRNSNNNNNREAADIGADSHDSVYSSSDCNPLEILSIAYIHTEEDGDNTPCVASDAFFRAICTTDRIRSLCNKNIKLMVDTYAVENDTYVLLRDMETLVTEMTKRKWLTKSNRQFTEQWLHDAIGNAQFTQWAKRRKQEDSVGAVEEQQPPQTNNTVARPPAATEHKTTLARNYRHLDMCIKLLSTEDVRQDANTRAHVYASLINSFQAVTSLVPFSETKLASVGRKHWAQFKPRSPSVDAPVVSVTSRLVALGYTPDEVSTEQMLQIGTRASQIHRECYGKHPSKYTRNVGDKKTAINMYTHSTQHCIDEAIQHVIGEDYTSAGDSIVIEEEEEEAAAAAEGGAYASTHRENDD